MADERRMLRLCGHDYRVNWDARLLDSPSQGEISYRRQEIVLCPSMQGYRQRAEYTLLHELIEGAVTYCEIAIEHDDLTRLANMLYAFLEENGLHQLNNGLPRNEAESDNGR